MDWAVAAVIAALAAAGLFILKTLVVSVVILLIKLALFMFACALGVMACLWPGD